MEQLQTQKEVLSMGLAQRLESLESSRKRITDGRFERIKQSVTNLGRDDLINMQHSIQTLNFIINSKLIPRNEKAELEPDFEFEK